jgi:transposase
MYRELSKRRKTGVTLQLLWQEYKADHPEGYQYSQYCLRYRGWKTTLDVVMRQDHRAGEKCFVDYAGMTMQIVNPKTGEVEETQIFVAALGASNFTYCEAPPSQKLQHWVDGHIHAFEYFGGVPHVAVPDNLKSGVKAPCFYEPDLNLTYKDLADHYDTVVIPTRVAKPKDKAKVENAVLQVERWVLAPLRKQTFFSIESLNDAIRERLEWLNDRPLSKLEGTRRSLFVEIDAPALKPLPQHRFVRTDWKINATVNIDYHVEYDGHYYSAPYQLARKKVDIRATWSTVELLFKNKRIASHQRSYRRGRHSTDQAHRPKSHQRLTWSPSRIIGWAESVGPQTGRLCETILERQRHPEQGYRSCLGIIRLGKRYDESRLEKACHRALQVNACSYRSVASILKANLDQQPLPRSKVTTLAIVHQNIRGAGYYNEETECSSKNHTEN